MLSSALTHPLHPSRHLAFSEVSPSASCDVVADGSCMIHLVASWYGCLPWPCHGLEPLVVVGPLSTQGVGRIVPSGVLHALALHLLATALALLVAARPSCGPGCPALPSGGMRSHAVTSCGHCQTVRGLPAQRSGSGLGDGGGGGGGCGGFGVVVVVVVCWWCGGGSVVVEGSSFTT